MKTQKNITIRFLAILSMLIFFLPFFQMCSDKNIKGHSSYIKSYGNAKTYQEREKAFEKSKKDFTLSGYELAMSFEPTFLGFTAIMLLNITIGICVFRKHKIVLFLSFLNLSIIILSFIMIAFIFAGLSQIRYGMFLCFLNSVLLLYFTYREQETAYNSRHA
jgi:hypothetical protein